MRRKVFDGGGHAHFVTFSCYRRRRLLDDHRAKGIVIHYPADELPRHEGACLGFVIMPDLVHGLLHLGQDGALKQLMKQWKQRSSIHLKKLFSDWLSAYAGGIDPSEPMWQPRYYDFNVFSAGKAREKLGYMHGNPVKAGLVERAEDRPFRSARWYLSKRSVGVTIKSAF